MSRNIRFCIDRGGTFTDVYAECGDKRKVLKLLSQDEANYNDAPTEGIRRLLEHFTGDSYPRGQPIDTSRIDSIRMGTTVATNALLERKGEPFALLITKGFKDLLHIGNQSRPRIFDLEIRCPELLYKTVTEVDERVVLCASKNASGREPRGNEATTPEPIDPSNTIQHGVTDELVEIRKSIDKTQVEKQLQAIYDQGITAIAVVFMHAAIYPQHEVLVGEIAKSIGFKQISLSHKVMQMVKIVPRGYTACADAYLTPHVVQYLDRFVSGFDKGLIDHVQLSFMQSDGGLTPLEKFNGHRAILSGPAGGVVGYAQTSIDQSPVIGFDMGGTSTDVSRYDPALNGRFEHVHESTTAGITIQAPQLNIVTVAAGGGSRLFFENGLFLVGPESAGAHPGPVCYRKGGYLAITDANLMLGRIIPSQFPNIFGETEDQPLDATATRDAFTKLTEKVKEFDPTQTNKTPEEVAYGFIQVANETMCRPIRELTQMKGYDITTHTLACFGGAGGQHACAIARNLGMKRIFIHRYSGILSAFGMGLADIVEERQEPSAEIFDPSSESLLRSRIMSRFEEMATEAKAVLTSQGIASSDISIEYYLNLRYQGTDCALMTSDVGNWNYLETFEQQYKREFGFVFPERKILVDDIRIRALGKSGIDCDKMTPQGEPMETPKPFAIEKIYFENGWEDTNVYKLDSLKQAANGRHIQIQGPGLIIDATSTILVEPFCLATVLSTGDVVIALMNDSNTEMNKTISTELDPIQLSIFSHRFMGIAEQMGRTLQRTSVSVNIKERLDFSCALFGPDGGLIANAPHIPVHLGAMQEAVRCQLKYWSKQENEPLCDGDVLVSNHPQLAGGSHLPDITVITPVFNNNEIVFWVASRGHHADIGGIAPGSMPPLSKYLSEEGTAIIAFKLVRKGEFREKEISDLLTTAPGDSPNCTGTRNLSDNLSDLKAQVAANNKGIALVQDLIAQYSLKVVHAYMNHIQENAEHAVRKMLQQFAQTISPNEPMVKVTTCDYLDDGSPIKLSVTIAVETGEAVFDFEGTGPEVFGNLNAPPAVTFSAVIYCLRCLVGQEIPLNQGCLKPVTIKIPPFSLLYPSSDAAVVGGNVLTSQRVVDVVLKAFNACAASQGCMNNLTFGDDSFGYYETIAGGAGAGPTWDGRSGVHTHMTNTRITDPEILERRYPVVLREFGLRADSGGAGKHKGGDGVVRELEFLRPLTLSILSERRSKQPYGLNGGESGQCGSNYLIKQLSNGENRVKSLGGKNTVSICAGDRIKLCTPGGGGFGSAK